MVGGDLVKQNGGVIQPVAYGGFDVQGQPFDIGQNMAGWCRLNLTSKRGSSVLVRYSELMAIPDMRTLTTLYVDNINNAAASEVFIFAEDDVEESFVPSFTIHGFRYIEIRGHRNTITADKMECYFVHSEVALIGNITMNSTVMNQIQHNIQWGQVTHSTQLTSQHSLTLCVAQHSVPSLMCAAVVDSCPT